MTEWVIEAVKLIGYGAAVVVFVLIGRMLGVSEGDGE